ncbi:acyl-CoA dehydrogenase family protein [Microbacterium sp. X-17]|uniref:acyl-CoA dehydrogenase family protein n=1 Tax=Microbacterium sp. X-17 TaxID=3144404 RepID=UPI0031F5C8D1
MDTSLNEVEEAVKDTYRRFFEKESTTAVVRASEPSGFDRALWNRLLELGTLSMALPGEVGGDDAGMVCVALAAEQLGRQIAPVPLIDAVAAARALARSGVPAARAAIEAMAAGDEIIVLAPRPTVDGVSRLVPHGAIADRIVVMDGDDLVLVPVVPDLSLENLGSLPLAHCRTSGEPVVLARGEDAAASFARAVADVRVLTGAALVGIADRSLELALEYVKVRKAFGIVIGSFQTVSHRLADDVVDIDGARLLVYEAAWSIDHGERAEERASMSFLFGAQVARRSSGDCLHFHGGVGFSMEHDSQLYYRRARSWPLAYTRLDDEYRRLADLLYGPQEG